MGIIGAAAASLGLAACAPAAGLDGDLDPDAVRGPLAAPPTGAPLPPPKAVYESARGADPAARAAARSLLEQARARETGAASGAVSFLDLPADAMIAAPARGVAVAALPLGQAPARADRAIRSALLRGLGGAIPQDRAFFAIERFLLVGQAAAAQGTQASTAAVRWTLIGADGARLAVFETRAARRLATGRGGGGAWAAFGASDFEALGSEAARRALATPRLRAAAQARAAPAAVGRSRGAGGAVAADGPKIRILGVSGAPGDGDVALARALEAAMRRAGFAVSDQAERAAVSAEARRRRLGSADRIRLVWRLRLDGRLLGEITQETETAAGALDDVWGPAAEGAAEAAAAGLVALLRDEAARAGR